MTKEITFQQSQRMNVEADLKISIIPLKLKETCIPMIDYSVSLSNFNFVGESKQLRASN